MGWRNAGQETGSSTMVGNQDERWCKKLLGGVEKMGKVVIPQSYCGVCHNTNMATKLDQLTEKQLCPDKRHSEHVADLSYQPGKVWDGHIPDWLCTTGAEEHSFKSSALTTIHPAFMQNTFKR